MRNIVTALALSLMIVGTWMFVRFRPGRLASGQAGVAFVEDADGSVRLANESRPEERTLPVKEATVESAPPPADGKSSSQAKTAAGKHIPKGSDEPWLTEFELTERSGKLISSESFRGKPYVVGFFYATCPSICVRQNEKFKILQDKFRDQPIRLIEITCDPEVDRPEVLAEYANRFEADKDQWLFFTGEMDYISRVGSEIYQIGVLRRGHPEKFALVDANGKIYGYYTWSDAGQWQALQSDMAKLISELPK